MYQFRGIEIEQIGDRNGTIRCIAEPLTQAYLVGSDQLPAVHVHHAQGRLHGTEVTRLHLICIRDRLGLGADQEIIYLRDDQVVRTFELTHGALQ